MNTNNTTMLSSESRNENKLANLALQFRISGVLGFVVLLFIVFSLLNRRFFDLQNIRVIAFNAAILIVAACAEAVVVLTRNLDVSIGSIMGLAAYLSADVASRHLDVGIELILLPLIIGALLGLFNGVLVAYGKIPSIIATLGTLSIYRGVTYIYAKGQEVTSTEQPAWVLKFADAMIAGIPSLVIIAFLVTVLMALFLRYWPIGRQIYAVGSSPEASYFYGLKTKRVILTAYMICGLLGGFAGFLYGARVGTVTVVLAAGWELKTLAAVIIGGVSVLGGYGNIVGVAFGAIVLATIDNGLVLLRVQEFWRMFFQGTAIILAVVIDAMIERRVEEAVKLSYAKRSGI